ncbi:MAG: hypothetical protein ACKVUS_04375 [Saprospiraceae bacterium]
MKAKNKRLFDELPESEYFKDYRTASKKFRKVAAFPDALGFDPESGGFIAVHRKHVDVALPDELPVCMILKKLGFGVVLLDEENARPPVDALIEERYFELKRVSKARNIQGAIIRQFRLAYHKAENMILHIDQKAHPESIRSALFHGVKKYPRIKLVWLAYEGQLWQLPKAMILEGKYRLK